MSGEKREGKLNEFSNSSIVVEEIKISVGKSSRVSERERGRAHMSMSEAILI